MKNLITLLAICAAVLMSVVAQAQQIRLFTFNENNHQFYEVIAGSGTGGRYVYRPMNWNGIYVHGYTDRVQRHEWIGTAILGKGVATVGLDVSGRNRVRLDGVPLPLFDFRRVSGNPFDDNVVVWVRQAGRTVSQRVPIGRRG